jgi:hypothetical protein
MLLLFARGVRASLDGLFSVPELKIFSLSLSHWLDTFDGDAKSCAHALLVLRQTVISCTPGTHRYGGRTILVKHGVRALTWLKAIKGCDHHLVSTPLGAAMFALAAQENGQTVTLIKSEDNGDRWTDATPFEHMEPDNRAYNMRAPQRCLFIPRWYTTDQGSGRVGEQRSMSMNSFFVS